MEEAGAVEGEPVVLVVVGLGAEGCVPWPAADDVAGAVADAEVGLGVRGGWLLGSLGGVSAGLGAGDGLGEGRCR